MTDEPVADFSRRRADVPTGVLVVGMAMVVWWPSFTLGAWGDLFFDQVLTIWAAATAALIVVLVEHRSAVAKTRRALLLLLPSVWLGLSFAENLQSDDDIVGLIVDLVAIVVVVVGAPFTLWVLAHIVWPDLGARQAPRTRWFIALVVVGIAAASFLLGANNSAFMTCEDFAVSGNSEPPGCVHRQDAE